MIFYEKQATHFAGASIYNIFYNRISGNNESMRPYVISYRGKKIYNRLKNDLTLTCACDKIYGRMEVCLFFMPKNR